MRVAELENVSSDGEVGVIMNLLRDKWSDLVKKGHYSLLFVANETHNAHTPRKFVILKNKDVLSKVKVGFFLFCVVVLSVFNSPIKHATHNRLDIAACCIMWMSTE